MRPALRRALSLLLVALAAVSVALAPVALAVHRAEVHHARCLEHGEPVEFAEVRGDVPHQDHHEPLALPSDHDQHDQHCAVDGGLASAITVSAHGTRPIPAAIAELPVLAGRAAPRGPPPLAYAPKTSPPTCA